MNRKSKRQLKGTGAPHPRQAPQQQQLHQHIDIPQQQEHVPPPPPPPPPKRERHSQRHHTNTNPPSVDANTGDDTATSHQHQSLMPSAEDEEDEADDILPRRPAAPFSPAASPKTARPVKAREASGVAMPTLPLHRAQWLKRYSNSPLAIARPYTTPLQTDESSEEEGLTVPSHPASRSPTKSALRGRITSNTEFDINVSELMFGDSFSGGGQVMITWTDPEESASEELDGDQLDGDKEQDFEELLSWGTNERTLPGMPEVADTDFWSESAPFMEIELLDTDSEGEGSESDGFSLDSDEEDEQMLAVRGLCASDTEGETTDSIDDTDQDGLVRFGIEQAGPSGRRGKKAPPLPSSPKLPVLGSLKAVNSTQRAIIEDAEPTAAPVLSPFSARKVRVLRRKAVSEASPSHGRDLLEMSPSLESTQSAPSKIGQVSRTSRSPISDIPEEDEDFMDLDDFLDATALHAQLSYTGGESDERDAMDTDMPDLSRWDRVPIGAYRKSRSPRKSLHDLFLPAMHHGSVSLADAPKHLPVADFLAARETLLLRLPKLRRKITRQEAIGLSPILCPIRPVPSAMKSRKQKRADRKAAKKSHRVSPTEGPPAPASPERSGIDVFDHEVPPLALPDATESLPATSVRGRSPIDLLPVPTLPSAECVPLDSPIFSAIRTRPSPHIFGDF